MIKIDHTALLPPEPATPILASHLLAIEEKQRTRFLSKGERIRTGCGEIDDYMLGGGCERGIVAGISAEAGESRLISLHLLASILLYHVPYSTDSTIKPPHPTKRIAIVIDTTGSFPISLLAKILKSRILSLKPKSSRQVVDTVNYAVEAKTAEDSVNGKRVDEEVQRCLEVVAMSRVFDVEGLWEVLGEVGRDYDQNEELLSEEQDEDGMEIVIIDNMTHLINELLARKERSEAHTLLTTLSRTIRTLTHTQNILTLLHNTTVATKSYASDPSNPYQSTRSRKQPNQNPQPASIFSSNPLKPALGQIFSQFPDLHLLMSQLPRTREDAERLYEQDDEEVGGGNGRAMGHCYVVEVLKDETPNLNGTEEEKKERKFGGREQRWAVVDISPDGLGLVDAFLAKENMMGLAIERNKGPVQDVGNVAKIYGFGGRRV